MERGSATPGYRASACAAGSATLLSQVGPARSPEANASAAVAGRRQCAGRSNAVVDLADTWDMLNRLFGRGANNRQQAAWGSAPVDRPGHWRRPRRPPSASFEQLSARSIGCDLPLSTSRVRPMLRQPQREDRIYSVLRTAQGQARRRADRCQRPDHRAPYLDAEDATELWSTVDCDPATAADPRVVSTLGTIKPDVGPGTANAHVCTETRSPWIAWDWSAEGEHDRISTRKPGTLSGDRPVPRYSTSSQVCPWPRSRAIRW